MCKCKDKEDVKCLKIKKKSPNSIMLRIGADKAGIKLVIRFSTVMLFAMFMSIGFVVGATKLGYFARSNSCED